jgi:hypothetical protein
MRLFLSKNFSNEIKKNKIIKDIKFQSDQYNVSNAFMIGLELSLVSFQTKKTTRLNRTLVKSAFLV